MKDREDKKHIIIDEFYKENFNREILENLEQEELDFKRSIEKMDEAMNLVESVELELDINLDKLISDGMDILDNRRNRRERILFILLSILILSLVVLISIIGGLKFILYFQVIIITLAPFIIIPIAKTAVVRGNR